MNIDKNKPVETEYLVEKWSDLLEDDRYPTIEYRKLGPIAHIFENQDLWNRQELMPRLRMLFESGDGPYSMSADIGGTYSDKNGSDPGNQYPNIIMSILRRAVPRYLGTELAAVVPLTQPVGYIYTLRAFADDLSDATEPNRLQEILIPGQRPSLSPSSVDVSGITEGEINDTSTVLKNVRYSTTEAELLGTKNYSDVAQNALSTTKELYHRIKFELDRFSVEVKSRALSASFSTEALDDYSATFNGLDVESELVRILSDQITYDLNQEILAILRRIAKKAVNYDATYPGTNVYKFMNSDIAAVDGDAAADRYGRWVSEKTRTFMGQIDAQAVKIAQETGRGLANVLVITPNLLSLLRAEGLITQSPNLLMLNSTLTVDNSFAGILNNQYRVFVDYNFGSQALPKDVSTPATDETVSDYVMLGYVGGPTDSGVFFCPYQLLQMFKATDPNSFENKMAFKSRYVIAQNAFDLPTGNTDPESFPINSSRYYRMFYVNDLPSLYA